ncbi:MAG: nodulation protein NfeD, partial [Thermodesulfovibrio sp.]|nr:nodulation protein NfeD [Thermodesulfovibrio sp.]
MAKKVLLDKIVLILVNTLIFLLFVFFSISAYAKEIIVLTIDGVINPPHAEYTVKGIKKAHEQNAEAVIIQLDTPGG